MPRDAASPTRPSDVPDAMPLPEIADRYHDHTGALVYHRHNLGDRLTGDQVAAHALAALVYQHALAERARYSRWCHVRDALRSGASVATVARAMGLDPDEVAAGLLSWADKQHRFSHITDDEHAEALLLAARQGPAPACADCGAAAGQLCARTARRRSAPRTARAVGPGERCGGPGRRGGVRAVGGAGAGGGRCRAGG